MRLLKPVVFGACLTPLALLIAGGFTGGLTANPIEFITHRTGDWTLRLLLVTLAITPLRRLTGWNAVIRLRRMLGLFAFFYGCLHLLTYVALDHFFALESMLEDLTERRFVTAGFTGFVLMVPLALTSSGAMVRRLGGRRWQALHRLVYGSACAGVIHYAWLVKADLRPPLLYAAVLALLLGYRLHAALRQRSRTEPEVRR